MTTVTRELPHGTITDSVLLRDELASKALAIGAACTDVTIDTLDLVTSTLYLTFDVAPDGVALDAAIAAYPTLPEPIGNSFAMLADDEYLLLEARVGEGESILFEVRIHAALGTASSFHHECASWHILVKREVGKAPDKPDASSPTTLGNIPGLRVRATVTADTVRVTLSSPRSGPLTILSREVVERIRGRVPA